MLAPNIGFPISPIWVDWLGSEIFDRTQIWSRFGQETQNSRAQIKADFYARARGSRHQGEYILVVVVVVVVVVIVVVLFFCAIC